MDIPVPQAGSNGRRALTELAPLADSLSKSVAAIAIAVYACGFLIVSIHHANFGFIGTNPFRPRILAAGAWFLFFSAIPITAAREFTNLTWTELARRLLAFWSFLYGLTGWFAFMLFDYGNSPNAGSHISWWVIAGAVFAFGLVAWLALSAKIPPPLGALASVGFVVFLVQAEVRRMLSDHAFDATSVNLWFFGVFLISLVGLKALPRNHFAGGAEWSRALGAIFALLLLFAQYYYPNLKASWGGGAPVPVTLYLNKDSTVKPNQTISARLVEESDEGFYIIGLKETRAIFIPRNTVALVYFSDNTGESSLLRDNKHP